MSSLDWWTLPFVRGKFVPEVESSGRAKNTLDLLLWLETPERTLRWFEELEQLRTYLNYFQPPLCSIRLFVPSDHKEAVAGFAERGIAVATVEKVKDTSKLPKSVTNVLDAELTIPASTALACDADAVVTDVDRWLPYVEEFEKLGILLTTPDFLLCYAEVFCRGHDLPWSFAYKAWFETWTGFYQLSEQTTFRLGIDFLSLCQAKGVGKDAIETGRSLVYNRLGDLCFTRDRLLYYEMQQAAAKRAQWQRQRFFSEVAYYLNFYYLLLYGAFDHAAVLINGALSLGLSERVVSARSPYFLATLKAKSTAVCAVFESPTHTSFIKRVGALRHLAAHRGVVTPGVVFQEPDHEPTVAELDEDIRKAGLDQTLFFFPPGIAQDQFRELLRTNARVARYKRETLMEDVVLVELDGKWSFIRPLLDTVWNFEHCTAFLNDVFSACSKALV